MTTNDVLDEYRALVEMGEPGSVAEFVGRLARRIERLEHALNDCKIHKDLPGIRERTACAVCFTETSDALTGAKAVVVRLEQEKRNQFEALTWIRQVADAATGIQRRMNDKRAPGAKGAVKLLIERFKALKDEHDRLAMTAADRERDYKALKDELDRLSLALAEKERAVPIEFDNHHNALACPYCNPKGLTLRP